MTLRRKVLKPRLAQRDPRGSISHLIEGGPPIRSVVLVTAKRGAVRANHFHKRDGHYAYMLRGRMRYTEAPASRLGRKRSWLVRAGDLIYTPPRTAHAMTFLADAAFLAFGTGHRDRASYERDTVRVQLVEP